MLRFVFVFKHLTIYKIECCFVIILLSGIWQIQGDITLAGFNRANKLVIDLPD